MTTPVRTIARVLGWAGVGIAAASLLARQQNGGAQLLVVLAVLAPYTGFLSAVSLAAQVAARSRTGIAVAAGVLVVAVAAQAPLYVRHGYRPHDALAFTVLSGNMRYGKADASHLANLARAEKADAVALQELTPQAVQRLVAAGLQRDYPYSQVAAGPDATGVGLWSKRPMTDKETYDGFTFHQVSARIAFDASDPTRTLTLFSTHVVAPWPGPAGLWVHELSRLAVILGSQTGVSIDAGDFNSTLDVAQFRDLLKKTDYADAAKQSGAGIVRTFPADTAFPPLLGIDHVLSRGAVATGVRTVALPGSDHRGIVVRLLLPTQTL